ncbi:hypothetical protein EBB54_27405 [Schaedlerella arabinosiphila]|uniref:C-methyltransferase domain-containing protein n=1 Tax=Schaedlerella arabinosiphila TaxID=2044587 RepID=A0A3R8KYN2_9FIRM|nr:hypothetical protein [Schaedlerella arabinosiphila]RRK34649.1 hypothetical protein EBB54_27405 [Schaedlerella arabinosiphila]
MNRELRKAKNLSDKHLMLFLLMNEWLKAKQRDRSVEEYLLKAGYKEIAVYGVSYVGQRFCDELQGSRSIKIRYCIDQKGSGSYKGYDIRPLTGKNEDVDAVIVTPIFYFEEIKSQIEKVVTAEVISIEEIIYGLVG